MTPAAVRHTEACGESRTHYDAIDRALLRFWTGLDHLLFLLWDARHEAKYALGWLFLSWTTIWILMKLGEGE